jgi:ABC-type multidrug transport system permease subunit
MFDESRLRAFGAMCFVRFREFHRESEVVFWSFVFPILLSVCLGLAFRNRPPTPSAVAVIAGPAAADLRAALEKAPLLEVRAVDEAQARADLRRGRVDLVVRQSAAGAAEYELDASRPEANIARSRVDDALQRAAGRQDKVATRDVAFSEPGGRYIDFLMPGILGMNIMSGGMWGVGFNLVDMRIKKLLKRLVATPMRRGDFLASIVVMRIAFMVVEAIFVLGFGRLAFGVPFRGSPFAVFAIGALGALCFGGMGLLLASRASRIEAVMGLMNVVMMPMFIASGVFFSSDRFPAALQPLIRALPLTALLNALRAVVLEGAPLASQGAPLLVLVLWGAVSFALGLRLFRWS